MVRLPGVVKSPTKSAFTTWINIQTIQAVEGRYWPTRLSSPQLIAFLRQVLPEYLCGSVTTVSQMIQMVSRRSWSKRSSLMNRTLLMAKDFCTMTLRCSSFKLQSLRNMPDLCVFQTQVGWVHVTNCSILNWDWSNNVTSWGWFPMIIFECNTFVTLAELLLKWNSQTAMGMKALKSSLGTKKRLGSSARLLV